MTQLLQFIDIKSRSAKVKVKGKELALITHTTSGVLCKPSKLA